MKRIFLKLFVIIVSMLSVFSCQKDEKTMVPPSANKQEGDVSRMVPPSEIKNGRIDKDDSMIASVNGTIITSEEVKRELDNLMMQYQGRFSPEQTKQMRPRLRKQAVESLINKLLLFKEADRNKIQPDTKEIEAEINRIASRFDTPEKFHEQLAVLGLSEKELRRDIEQNLKINKLLEDKLPAAVVTDEEVNAFYKKNPENFNVAEQVRASHILLKLNPDESDEVKKQKRLVIADLRNQLEKGANFEELARNHSECPSKDKGGDMGFFSRGAMVKPFEEAAFNLKLGEVSNIVETQFGFHLIKLVDLREARTIPLGEVKDKILSHLKSQKQGQAINTYLKQLRPTAKIEYAEGDKQN